MFDFNKIKDFDNHIALSIPGYPVLTDLIRKYADYIIEEGTNVYDVGCSTGALLKSLPVFKGVQYYGIDNSRLLPDSEGDFHFIRADLKDYDSFKNASLVCSVFTLQFLSRITRRVVVDRIKEALNPGGAFVVCEKILSPSPRLQSITNSLYYEYKQQHFSADEILEKERALRSNMRIRSLKDLYGELSGIGTVEVFWKSYNFVGLICTRDT